MSDGIEARIAEVAHDHYPLYCNERGCDTGGAVGGWAAHLSRVLAEELGLTEEWAVRPDSADPCEDYESEDEARRFCPPGSEVIHRYVTDWES